MKHITIKPDSTIRQAMKQLSQVGERCLVVTDEKNSLLGTLTDGDLRKAILKGASFEDSISSIYQQDPTTLTASGYTLGEAKKLFVQNKFDLIPILDENRTLVDVLFLNSVLDNVKKNKTGELHVPVVIMAGGRGTRMEPFTKVLPKPLVPIHDKPVIEHIIERFTEVGCSEFHLMVNYKGRILKAYFEELQPENYKVEFVEEQNPLGTAGSLRFLEGEFDNPFFVTNCDIIIKSDYGSLYEFHQNGGYAISLVASAKQYIIPYGTCELNGEGHLAHINEKPSYNFLVNTGLYVLNPEVLELVPENTFFHITQLIEKVKNRGMKVGVFPIGDDDWIDIGQWTEYRKALDLL
jgi:dTDP-glucose pyrophosphorylase